MDKDLISIIIPVYNVEMYLSRCLESVISQTYKNLEIILVDDGSIDSSGKICDEYAQKDKRITVIHKENGGLSDARNVGIKAAKGDFIAFVDSDDFIDKEYVGYLYALLKKSAADIAVCGYLKGTRGSFPNQRLEKDKIFEVDSREMLSKWHGRYTKYETVAWNKLYKKELFIKNGIYYPKGCWHEDVQTTHLLVAASKKIIIGKQKLYYYYQRADSITGNVSEKAIYDCMYSISIRLDFFQSHGYEDVCLRLKNSEQKRCMYYYYLAAKYHKDDLKHFLLKIFCKNYPDVMIRQNSLMNKGIFFFFRRYHKIFDYLL